MRKFLFYILSSSVAEYNAASVNSLMIGIIIFINLCTAFKYRSNRPQREKTCLRGVANNKGADHPRILISTFVIRLLETCYERNFSFLASLWSWAVWFESDFVGNPEDRFSATRPYLMIPYWSKIDSYFERTFPIQQTVSGHYRPISVSLVVRWRPALYAYWVCQNCSMSGCVDYMYLAFDILSMESLMKIMNLCENNWCNNFIYIIII